MSQSLPPLGQLSLAKLEQRCREETQHYRRAEPSDPSFCLEIFQRALRLQAQAPGAPAKSDGMVPMYADEEARDLLVQIYTDYIKAHINRTALSAMPIDELVQQAWLRFWQAANTGLTFTSLQAALRYLKLTTVSALLNEQRLERERQRYISLQELAEVNGKEMLAGSATDPVDQYTRERFRARCREVLTDALAYQIFWMRYSIGMPPREIAQELKSRNITLNGHPVTARKVSDMLDQGCKRLQLDSEIRALLAAD